METIPRGVAKRILFLLPHEYTMEGALCVWVNLGCKGTAPCTFHVWLNHGAAGTLKADSHIACRVHAVPLPCHATKGLECVFPICFKQCGRVWFTVAMLCPCPALIMPFFARPWHSTAVEIRPVGYLPAFGFFRLPRGVPRRLLPEAYQSFSQRSITTTVKSGSSTLQKKTIC